MESTSNTSIWLFNRRVVNVLSVAIPVAVALLIGIRTKLPLGAWTAALPHVIGALNSLTAGLLVAALVAIKNKKVDLHRNLMYGAFGLGAIFLVLYILYHISNPSTPFGGQGWVRPVYYFLLISHIGLSIVVVRFVLLAMHYALTKQFAQHRRIVKIAYPLWLYVSVSGVLVYWMISPYYSH
jgi:putative membrane protein